MGLRGWARSALPDDSVLPGALHRVDLAVNDAAVGFKRRVAGLRPVAIVAYRGWVGGGRVRLRARCLESPNPPLLRQDSRRGLGWGAVLRTNLRKFTALKITGMEVFVQLPGPAAAAADHAPDTRVKTQSDNDGYVTLDAPAADLAPGWHPVTLAGNWHDQDVSVTGEVLVVDPAADLVIVSDIDDTILQTGLTQGMSAAVRTLLREVADRRPVAGMAGLYRDLAAAGPAARPFFYVSTGSWNYYKYLTEFLVIHEYPKGPLLLTDWGPTRTRYMRDGAASKRTAIRGLMRDHPQRFVLIGDIGQSDPHTYEVIAREFPERVAAILLIAVGSHFEEREAEVAAQAARLREEGIPAHFVADSAVARRVAADLGLLGPAGPGAAPVPG
ncbi:MAG: App1 family protein [Candidatus Nanopelagicales bacterium]